VSQPSGAFFLDDSEHTLSVLAEHLERFVGRWEESTEPPDLAEFLPASGEIRRLTLVELIKIDLEYRWVEHNHPKRIFDYFREFPELTADRVPSDLVYEEFHIRRQAGLAVDPQEYLDAFPAQADEIARLLGLDQPYVPSSLFANDKHQRLDEIEVGQTIDEFDLLAQLGKGAFAKVFLARQKSMQRLVALKISVDNSSEPQTLAQLDHDFIVRVFDQRLVPDLQLRLLYMQYVAGGTLQSVLHRLNRVPADQRSGRLLLETVDQALEARGEMRPVESPVRERLAAASWPEAVCWLGSRLARALDYAHRQGVLHRDIKPANVLLSAEGVPKLADFNISFSSKLEGATPAAYFGGSLAYMSPEQLEACNPAHERTAESLDGRSDLYSLGVVLWELLAGGRPFLDEGVEGGWTRTLEMMAKRRRDGFDRQRAAPLPADCPPGLQGILERCLHPDPAARWQSGEELARRLELCTKPGVQQLLHPDPDSWRVRLRKFAVPIVVLATIVPNALAGRWNLLHNEREVIEHLSDVRPAFDRIVLVVNSIAYPVGLALAAVLAWIIQRGIRRLRRGKIAPAQLRFLESLCLRLGHYAGLIGVIEWTIAGIAYPISIQLVAGHFPLHAWVHFFASLFLCGLVAAAYPFFAITLFSLRVLYPALLEADPSRVGDEASLNRLGVLMPRYLVTAALLPLMAIALLIVAPQVWPELGIQGQLSMSVLSVGGGIGYALIFWLYRQLQADLQTFQEVARTD